jgi:hypothetical protein
VSAVSDFDFLHGAWNVRNRCLVARLEGSEEWEEFPATAECLPLLGGAANVDWIDFPTKGSSGLTLRLFDRDREEWSIHWASSRTGRLDPPVVGRFEDGRGDFWGDDTHDGQPIRVHFTWWPIADGSARWEQEFSADGGRTWEPNWVMELTRVGTGAPQAAAGRRPRISARASR